MVKNDYICNMEIWKEVKGFEGLYEISNLGRVKSLERYRWNGFGQQIVHEKILRNIKTAVGYYKVTLGRGNQRYIHRLIGENFLDMIDGKNLINHKNGNKLDNSIMNLEWCTQAENNQHAYDTGLNPGNKGTKWSKNV